MNLALVGGGQTASVLLPKFAALPNVNILGVADPNPAASGIVMARHMGIRTVTDFHDIISLPNVEIVIEITGVRSVNRQVAEALRADQELIGASSARLMFDLIEAQNTQNARAATEVTSRLDALTDRLGDAIRTLDRAKGINSGVLRKMNYVTINAKIEAGRLGRDGAGFGAVTDELADMNRQMQATLTEIDAAIAESETTVGAIRQTRADMESVFERASLPTAPVLAGV